MIRLRTLTDGGQQPAAVAGELIAFLDAAERTLELALYDIRLPGELGDSVRAAIEGAADRGVAVRLAYNVDHARPIAVPPPPRTMPGLIESLRVPTKAIPGVPDLMHHKYVVRDHEAVWTGSTNWTEDSWSREENAIVTVGSPEVAALYGRDFEQLWTTADVERSGYISPDPVRVGDTRVRVWFSPGYGDALAHKLSNAIGRAKRRIRIASPVITAGPILGSLAEAAADGKVDVAGVVDATQVHEVIRQWEANGHASWKIPALHRVLASSPFSGKPSTPHRWGSVHDYMHAKLVVADDVLYAGSYNLSHSGELNAENVLEIEDAALAEQAARFVDELRARYAAMALE